MRRSLSPRLVTRPRWRPLASRGRPSWTGGRRSKWAGCGSSRHRRGTFPPAPRSTVTARCGQVSRYFERTTRILFAGDSGAGPHWAEICARLGEPDVALLPIGAYEPRWFMASVHMNPAEAVDAHISLGARHSVGMHFGTFQLTDEAIDAPERALAVSLREKGILESAFVTQGFGETRAYFSQP